MVEKTDRPVKGILFKIGFEGKPEKGMAVTAYVFDRKGSFITSAPVQEGQVELDITEAQAKRARFFFGPPLQDKRERKPTIELMERINAYEPMFTAEPKKRVYIPLPIPVIYWDGWLLCQCRVRGKVVSPIEVNGITEDLPVYNARVHICEVDKLRFVIPRLPDFRIDLIRNYVIYGPPTPPPPPEFSSGPVFQFDPAEMDFTPEKIARMNIYTSTKPNPQVERRGPIWVELNPQPEPPIPAWSSTSAINYEMKQSYSPHFTSSPAATQAALQSPSLPTVKKALLANLDLIRPFLCYWPWIWPYFHSLEELAVVETDAQGIFDTTIYYLFPGDHPDLYFWVEYCIGEAWTTVYRRPVYCSTYWDYVCGSEVILRIKDVRVPGHIEPPSLPGTQVAVMLMGNNISLNQILGEAAGVRQGLIRDQWTSDGRPFGGSIEPHVCFGAGLIDAGISYYRWSYKRVGTEDTPHAMDRQVIRHYYMIDPVTKIQRIKPYVLGPDPKFETKTLFKIPTIAPPEGGIQWAFEANGRENSASAFFLSQLLDGGDTAAAAGKYELLLELFDSSGNLVVTDPGVWRVPILDGPFGPNQEIDFPQASPDYLYLNEAGKVTGFHLVLHVDNNPCLAIINETQVGSQKAGPCGFINYLLGSEATISFRAYHPNNFAKFWFSVVKGSAGYQSISIPYVDENTEPGWSSRPYVDDILLLWARSPESVFSRNVPVSQMLGTCPESAAFGENLHVYATATDGWVWRLEYLDAYAVPMAFALTPLKLQLKP
jgi:hypothetical protein